MTETHDLNLSLDQNLALRSAAEWVEGKALTGRPAVLFLCTHNAGRSQMALGFFQRLAGDRAVAWSGGSEPGDELNPAAVEAMHERGIDITGEFPKPWTDEILRATDVIITMGCGDACPVFLVSDTKTGRWMTQQERISTLSGRSGTRSNDACGTYSTSSVSPPRSDHSCPWQQSATMSRP